VPFAEEAIAQLVNRDSPEDRAAVELLAALMPRRFPTEKRAAVRESRLCRSRSWAL
jgi:hypothetical protein